jgi:hypothetical protein
MFHVLDSPTRSRTGRLMLLAPSVECVPDAFRRVDANPKHHARTLAGLQRLRGRVYLQDGAIEASQLTTDGRHRVDADDRSWHLVSVQPDGRVTGCARYRPHDERVRPEDLAVWRSPLARHRLWRTALRMAVEGEIERARQRDLAYVEVGGWAIAQERRFTPEALEIALFTYALAENVGGCIGITTATVRNCSSRILRKLGGRSLEVDGCVLPSYYDPQYRCEMEILRFDSTAPNPRFADSIRDISNRILDLPVLCAASTAPSLVHLGAGVPFVPALSDQACA